MANPNSVSAQQLAAFVEVDLSEIEALTRKGVLKKGKEGYALMASLQGFIRHLKQSNDDDNSQSQQVLGEHVGITDRSVREVCGRLGLDSKKVSRRQFRLAYISDMREKAAGRGGDGQDSLTKARTEESMMKSAKMRIEYLRELGQLIHIDDAANVIVDWCRQANIDYTQGFHNLVSEIQNQYSIDVDKELVESIVFPTTERIKIHADKLAKGLVESVEDIPEG